MGVMTTWGHDYIKAISTIEGVMQNIFEQGAAVSHARKATRPSATRDPLSLRATTAHSRRRQVLEQF